MTKKEKGIVAKGLHHALYDDSTSVYIKDKNSENDHKGAIVISTYNKYTRCSAAFPLKKKDMEKALKHARRTITDEYERRIVPIEKALKALRKGK